MIKHSGRPSVGRDLVVAPNLHRSWGVPAPGEPASDLTRSAVGNFISSTTDQPTEEVCHETRLRRRALLSRSCPSGAGGILSETNVKRGHRVVHGTKELHEKLGRNDPCPCGSRLLFKRCCLGTGCFRRSGPGPLRALAARKPSIDGCDPWTGGLEEWTKADG